MRTERRADRDDDSPAAAGAGADDDVPGPNLGCEDSATESRRKNSTAPLELQGEVWYAEFASIAVRSTVLSLKIWFLIGIVHLIAIIVVISALFYFIYK